MDIAATRRVLGSLALLLVVVGLGAGAVRVRTLESSEMELQTEPASLRALAKRPGSTPVSARLAETHLKQGEQALFEVCSDDGFAPERWRGALGFAVFRLEPLELMLRTPLDRERLGAVRRNDAGGCLTLARGPIEDSGRYSIDAVWPDKKPDAELMRVPLRARILARTALVPMDKLPVFAVATGALLLLIVLAFGGKPALSPLPAIGAAGWLGAGAGIAGLLMASYLPLWGSLNAMIKGTGMASIQVGIAVIVSWKLCAGRWRDALALVRPERSWRAFHTSSDTPRVNRLYRLLHILTDPVPVWLTVAVVAAISLVFTAQLSVGLVPSTSEAPIQSFISWPSGMLAFATLGVLLPLAEELFFRGYLYRVALSLGKTGAFVLSLLCFVGLHAPQSWGNWGGLLAIAITGLVLTALRALSGSSLVPALTHLLYNFWLSMGSL